MFDLAKTRWGGLLRQRRMTGDALADGRINRRAAAQFTQVLDQFSSVLTGQADFALERTHPCSARLRFSHVQSHELLLYYELKNMLFGRCYDLFAELHQPAQDPADYTVCLQFSGGLRQRQASFALESGTLPDPGLLDRLNHPLILARVHRLDLVELKLTYSAHTGQRLFSAALLRGSCTWCLMPPLFQRIPLHKQDCIDLLELMLLLAGASPRTPGGAPPLHPARG